MVFHTNTVTIKNEKKNENMPQASPATSISGEVTKLLLQHESMASLRSKLPISNTFCGFVASLHIQYGVNLVKNVVTQSKSNISAVFKAIRTKAWE